MGKIVLFQGFLDRIKNILSNGKDKERDIEVISKFEKGLSELSLKKAEVKIDYDDFVSACDIQIAQNSILIKGEDKDIGINNLKFIRSKKERVEKGYQEDLLDLVIQYNNLEEKYIEFKEVFLKANELKYKNYLASSLNKTRESMPQINVKDIDSFLIHFSGKSKGAKITKSTSVLKSLKPAQKDFDEDKIITGLSNNNWKDRTYIISKDNYILDGHHSWATGIEMDEDQSVSTYKVNLPIKELIKRSKLLKISIKKDVNGNIVKSIFQDFIESDEDMIEFLSSKQLVVNTEGYNKIAKGDFLSEDDIIVGTIDEEDKFDYSHFNKEVKFIQKGEKTNCLIMYSCDDIQKALVEDSDDESELDNSKVINNKSEEVVVEKGIENSEEGVKNKTYSDVILQDSEGRVLFLKRSGTDTFGAGQFSLPGGKIEEGESPEAAVVREVKEETGIDLKEVKFLKKEKNVGGGESNYFHAEFGKDDVIVLDNNEHDNWIWADKNYMQTMDMILDLKDRVNTILESVESENIIKSQQDRDRYAILVNKGNELIKGFDAIVSVAETKDDAVIELEKSSGYSFEDYPKPIRYRLDTLLNQKFS